jgi:hypothetical protein
MALAPANGFASVTFCAPILRTEGPLDCGREAAAFKLSPEWQILQEYGKN